MKTKALLLSLLFVLVACNEQNITHKKPIYIAHAGGMIGGHKYTNSLEAVQNAIAHGISYIELDLCLTSDSQLIAAYNWRHFHKITGFNGDSVALTLDQFKHRTIYEQYTPLTWTDIDSIMNTNPNLHLVTDKISSPEILNRYFWTYRNRVFVECFSLDDYYQLSKDGYYCMLSGRPPFNNQANTSDIKTYTFWYIGIFGNEDCTYQDFYGDTFFVFTLPDKNDADSLALLDSRIKYVYIDSVE